MTALLDLEAKTEFGRSFATRERAQDIVAALELSPDEPVRLRIGLQSMCAPGFIQGLLGALGTSRLVVVEPHSCPPEARARLERIAAAFGSRVEFS